LFNFSFALANWTGANSGAPARSARCTESWATASLSLGTGVLAHAAMPRAAAATTAPPARLTFDTSNFIFTSSQGLAANITKPHRKTVLHAVDLTLTQLRPRKE
jgi:hypothetical protein